MPVTRSAKRRDMTYKYVPNYPTYHYGRGYKRKSRASYKAYRPVPTKAYTPKPLKAYRPVPLKEYTPKPLKDYTPVPVKDYQPKPLKPYTPVPLKAYTPKPVKYERVPLKPYRPKPLKDYTPVPIKPYTPKPIKPYVPKSGGRSSKTKGIPLENGRSKEICPYCGGEIILPTTGRLMLCKYCKNKVRYSPD